jgi:hypothetical protein
MKNCPAYFTKFMALIPFLINLQMQAQPQDILALHRVTLTARLVSEIKPLPVLTAMQRVADWQLATPSTNAASGWIQAAGDAGFMALAGISGDVKYRDRKSVV